MKRALPLILTLCLMSSAYAQDNFRSDLLNPQSVISHYSSVSKKPKEKAHLSQEKKTGKIPIGKTLSSFSSKEPKNDADGNIMGYELGPGRDPGLFADVGLQQGDVAIQVNDIKLNNPANSARALKSLQRGNAVSVIVLRNGQQQTLSLSVPE